MRAQIFGEGDIARLVEGAGEVARLQHRAQHRGRVARIGAQIAVAQVGRRKQRLTAAEVDQDIAVRLHVLARRSEDKLVAR